MKVLKSLEDPTMEQVYLEVQQPMEGAHEMEMNMRRNECQKGTIMDRPLPQFLTLTAVERGREEVEET